MTSDPALPPDRRRVLRRVLAAAAGLPIAALPRPAQAGESAGFPIDLRGLATPVIDPGAKPEETTRALEDCVAQRRHVVLPAGTWRITRPIELMSGQIVMGSGTLGPQTPHATAIVNEAAGGGCFWYTRDRSTGVVPMPMLVNLELHGEHPVRFNPQDIGVVADGGASNIPYGAQPAVRRCVLRPLKRGTGIGIAWTKMFDGTLAECDLDGFDINVLLNGCDICGVDRNRLYGATSYHVLELSCGSFGSQNRIANNDMLQAGSERCIFIKTTARHVRLENNYLEAGPAPFVGFIDASDVATPKVGPSPPGERLSTVIRDNRIDGMTFARQFVYRYAPDHQVSGEIVDPGTSGPLPRVPGLLLVDGQGRARDSLPVLYNELHVASFRFASPAFGGWNGYATRSAASPVIDAGSITMFGAALHANGFDRFLRIRDRSLLLDSGFGADAVLTLHRSLGVFAPGAAYRVTVRARTLGVAETLGIAALNPVGQPIRDVALSGRFADLQWIVRMPDADQLGFRLRRSGNGAVIEIASIALTDLHVQSWPPTMGDRLDCTLTGLSGEIHARADDGAGATALLIGRIVFGDFVPTGTAATDPDRLRLNATLEGHRLRVLASGRSPRKSIEVVRTHG